MFIGTDNDIPNVENVRTIVKSGGHMSDKINKKCLLENQLWTTPGLTIITQWKIRFEKPLQHLITEFIIQKMPF